MIYKILTFMCLFFYSGRAIDDCPISIASSGFANDLGLLSDQVSSEEYDVQGLCGLYKPLLTVNAIYDTRVRLYQKDNNLFILFRPTQQTNEGGDIHVNRRLVSCQFINDCQGMVHERFQEAFIGLVHEIDWQKFYNYNVYIGGHSLGGAFAIFMGIFLYKNYNITPKMILGIAGPFIGDEKFNQNYLAPLKEIVNDWWQIENYNDQDSDLTVEKYNVDYYPYISVYEPAVCKVFVNRIWDSYGMHDLRNYRQALIGKNCD